MPIEHIVLVKLKEGASTKELEEKLQCLLQINGVEELSFGKNYSGRSHFTHGLLVRFSSKDAESLYQGHPDHVMVRDQYLVPLCEKDATTGKPVVSVVDYECEPKKRSGCPLNAWPVMVGVGVFLGIAFARSR